MNKSNGTVLINTRWLRDAVRWSIAALPLLTVGACHEPSPSMPRFAPRTTLTLDSSRCSGVRCSCLPLEPDEIKAESDIGQGRKRFEFRLARTTSKVWVKVADRGVFYKPASEIDPVCFYVDLPTGEHPVTLTGEVGDPELGLQLGMTVHEYGDKVGPNWYKTFRFVCGTGASTCSVDELEAWKAFQRRLPKGVLDPCGSVRVQGVAVEGRRAGRHDAKYESLALRLRLNVYEFQPYHRPGSPKCKGPTSNR